jgi:hypothetical protein
LTSGGNASSLYCDSEETILTFQILNSEEMELKVQFMGKTSTSQTWKIKSKKFETSKCINGILNERGWG